MEKLFSLQYGIGGICVLLTISILLKTAEFLWKIKERKDLSTEETMKNLVLAVQENTTAIKKLESTMSTFPKLEIDLRRSFAALKDLAGDKWPVIRDNIMKDFPV